MPLIRYDTGDTAQALDDPGTRVVMICPGYSKIWDQGVTKSRIGRYREILNTDEIKIVKNTTRKIRDMFG